MTPADILAFERQHPVNTPTKNATIRRELGITETRYYLLLSRAASSAAGITADPVTARMIRERAAQRRLERERRTAV